MRAEERLERALRRYDRALRVRRSLERPVWFLERKAQRGRIGDLAPDRQPWPPDMGRRYEEGHVLIAEFTALPPAEDLLRALRAMDTWYRWDLRRPPYWRQVEEAEQARAAAVRRSRRLDLQAKASEVFDRYVWRYRQRVSVPEQIQ